MKRRLFSILQYVIFLGGGIFLVWWQLRAMTGEERVNFYASFGHANYWVVIPVVIMCLLSHISRSMRWKLLMEPLGYNPALKNVFAVTMVGYLANAAIPRLGEVLKCTFLARYENLKVDRLVGTIIIERIFDFVCYLIFIGVTILIQIDVVGDFVRKKLEVVGKDSQFPMWAKLAIVVFLVILMIVTIKFLFRRFPGNMIISRINNFFKGIAEGFKTIKTLKRRGLFILHTLFIWLMYLMQIYVGFSAMEGTAHLGWQAAFSVLSLATLAMIITPGGIGSFPIFVMQTLLLYDVVFTVGNAFGWLMWGVSTGIVIVAGFIALGLLPYINKKRKHEISKINPVQNI
jgi:glycosyltransferase 2 family protein